MLLGLLHGFVRNGAEAWQYTLDHLGLFYERALAGGATATPHNGEQLTRELAASYLEVVRLLGTRTAQLHIALSTAEEPAMVPEPYTDFYRHGLYHGMTGVLSRTVADLRRRAAALPEKVRADANAVLARDQKIRAAFQTLRDQRIQAMRIRIHGDFHLGQALYTGKDFVFLDFEGDPARPLSERRIKRSPLHDVAGMLDSFYHASHSVLFGETPGVIPSPESIDALEAWARLWYGAISEAYLNSYLGTEGIAQLLPPVREQCHALLKIFLLERSLRKLSYQLTFAPERIRVPARSIINLVEPS
jgi:maltose alpha-D-glucosyltransferase/alpha-amylase